MSPEAVLAADSALRAWLASHHTPALDWLMLTASAIGSRGSIWLILGATLAIVRPQRAPGVWQLVLAIGLSVLVTDAVAKPAVGRPRPFRQAADVRVIAPRPANYSFPSGHAANAFAGGLALARIWPGARVAIWTLAALVAISRVYVGVHYPLDIVGGALLGLLLASFAIGGTVWPDVEGQPARHRA